MIYTTFLTAVAKWYARRDFRSSTPDLSVEKVMSMASQATLLTVTPLVPAGPNLHDALRFYTEELGFATTWQGGEMAGVRRGGVAFNLVQNRNPIWAENASASIGVDDLNTLYMDYRSVSENVGPLEVKSWGRREFHMILPSGVCLQFYQVEA